MPVVTADLGEIVDQPVMYLRLAINDMPRQGTRHEVNLSISGPPADLRALVAELAAAVEQTSRPRGERQLAPP
jgi:hypothetical protein